MRYVIFALLGFALPAYSAYDVTATMPATSGATGCQLYLDGVAVGGVKSCGAANLYPALVANPGTYAFAYKAVNGGGESALSPVTTVSIEVTPPPEDPTNPPVISVACDPSPCPQNIVITVSF